jgi:hypothetical protein
MNTLQHEILRFAQDDCGEGKFKIDPVMFL